jgi:hypothetical protein
MPLFFLATLSLGCSSSGDKTDDADVATDTDVVDTVQPGDTDEVAQDTDVVVEDTDVAGGLVAADLVGTFEGNAPVTACYTTILDHSVVVVTAVDADTVQITDSKVTLTCDIVGDTLDCPAVLGVETSIAIDASNYCDWPYTVSTEITGVTADAFTAAVAFSTSPSQTNPTCAAVLSSCSGSSTATFTKFVPSADNATPPAAKAMVSSSR